MTMIRQPLLLLLAIPSLIMASPLSVYDQAERQGSETVISNTFSIYSGSEIPDGLDNNISSFRLAANHMLIVADEPTGLGPGKTYIADGADLVIETLPPELENVISFLRVVPWRPTLKKGTGGDLSDNPSVNASWYYRWGFNVEAGQALESREYVPMSWGAGGASDESIPNYLAMDQVSQLLGFNESDNCNDQSGQYSNLCDVATAVGFYENLQKAGLRLGSPATREEGARNSTSWLSRFIDQAEATDIRIDFVALHWYDWGSSPAGSPNAPATAVFERFKRYLSNAYHLYRRPLWITEFNANPNRVTNVQDEFMKLALPYLESLGYVERYAWFQPFSGTGDFFSEGQLTSTGEIYRDQVSTPAYTSGALHPLWQSQDIGNPTASGKTIQSQSNFTVCGSGTGIGGTSDSFHYTFKPLSGDGSLVTRIDGILHRDNSKAGLMIRESLDAGSKSASLLMTSNGQLQFQHRFSANGETETKDPIAFQTPYWLKVERLGNTISGHYSSDGENWIQLASESIDMDEEIHIGMAVSSQDGSTFCDAIFNISDSDDDQLPDTWERSYFGDLTTTGENNANYDGDPDSDLKEFSLGTDPTDSRSFFRSTVTQASSGYLEISFDGVAGQNYELEVSELLTPESWSSINSLTPTTDGMQVLGYTHPENLKRLFGRIKSVD